MNLNESFLQAFSSLKSNKLRSILTMLGVIMGVFSIITIVTIGDAAKAYMDSKFEQLGANIIEIKQKTKTVNENDWLKLDDLETIRKAVPVIKDITAYSQAMGTVRIGQKTRDAVVIGITSAYKNFRPLEIYEGGRFIIDNDEKARNNVVIVNESFAQKYFNTVNIVGKTIELKDDSGIQFNPRVIGVIKSQGNIFGNMFGDDFPVIMYMPVTTVQAITGTKKLEEILVSVVEKDKLKDVGMSIIRLMEFKHGGKDKYTATNSADMQKTVSDVMGVVQWVLLVIAIITLVVGGIGIVNILLVSVTERIREIGVRKALGAQKRDIIMQFLTESIIMTGISGLIGVFLGILAGGVASSLIDIPTVVNMKVILASFLGSVLLGMLFGVYPAKKAADLDPIESLRYE